MITQNLINKTAQRIQKNIQIIEVKLKNEEWSMPLKNYESLMQIRDSNRHFLIFLESASRENKTHQIKFEKDLKPIIEFNEKIEEILK